jgi:hypothetical protein
MSYLSPPTVYAEGTPHHEEFIAFRDQHLATHNESVLAEKNKIKAHYDPQVRKLASEYTDLQKQFDLVKKQRDDVKLRYEEVTSARDASIRASQSKLDKSFGLRMELQFSKVLEERAQVAKPPAQPTTHLNLTDVLMSPLLSEAFRYLKSHFNLTPDETLEELQKHGDPDEYARVITDTVHRAEQLKFTNSESGAEVTPPVGRKRSSISEEKQQDEIKAQASVHPDLSDDEPEDEIGPDTKLRKLSKKEATT